MKRMGIVLLLVLTALFSQAQYPHARNITLTEGLMQNSVHAMDQDMNGLVWIATQDGIQRYDGYSFKNYRHDPKDPKGIPSGSINHLLAHSDGSIWFAVRAKGILILDPATDSLYHLNSQEGFEHLSHDNLNEMIEYKDGRVLVAYSDGGIDIIDPKSKKISRIGIQPEDPNGLPPASITSLTIDHDGKVWAGTYGAGVVCYDMDAHKGEQYTTEKGKYRLLDNTARAVFCDSKNRIWVSNWHKGYTLLDLKNGTSEFSSVPGSRIHALRHGLAWCFTEDQQGYVCIGSAEQGVMRFHLDKQDLRFYKGHNELRGTITSNNVMTLFVDKNGLIWAGTWTGGIGIFDPNKEFFYSFRHVSDEAASLPNNIVWRFFQTKSGIIYVGTGTGGVSRFDLRTGEFSPLELKAGQRWHLGSGIMVNGITEDNEGNTWFCTNGSGLYRYDPKEKMLLRMGKKDPEDDAVADEAQTVIHKGPDGQIYVGYNGAGLRKIDPATLQFTQLGEENLRPRTITEIIDAGDGILWIGTVDVGLLLYDTRNGKLQSVDELEGFPKNLREDGIYCIYPGTRNDLWVGTPTGLHFVDLKTKETRIYTMQDGLPNNVVNAVIEDKSGKFWISTNSGLALFHPASGTFRTFNEQDGFQGEYNQGAGYRLRDGRLLFGGIDGITLIVPARASVKKNVSPVNFTDLRVFNKPYKGIEKGVTYLKEFTLSYRDYVFSLDFASADYSNPDKVEYKYKLDGFDDDWVELGHAHTVTFTNIDPGTYTLLVNCTNSEGVWGKSPSQISITITPPFWRTTWFYTVCVVLIILIVYAYMRWRERKLRQEKMILESKVEERTHELREEKEKVEEAHREIKDSINYAKRIQESILPNDEEIRRVIPELFILFRPKDVVSGDFFWHYRIPGKNEVVIAAADCTGHGVPGAFMSMIGNTLLNEIVKQKHIHMPDQILNELHIGVRYALQQDRTYSDSRDGMDICLCHINTDTGTVQFAGANRPLLILRQGEFKQLKPDKNPIGGLQQEKKREFSLQRESLQRGDRLYLFSDGIIDQFGGADGKKFKLSRLKDKLQEYSVLNMQEQGQRMADELDVWKGNLEQTDDICLIGIAYKGGDQPS